MFSKQLLGGIASVVTLLSYVPYIKNILRGKTKPHMFSWFVWSMLAGIAFGGQIVGGSGPGAWLMGIISFMCFTIFLMSLKKGTKDIQVIDWVSLGGALLAMIMWIVTKTPLLSVILITATDILAFFPTIRKSFSRPYEETILTYLINTLKFILGILATNNYSVITVLYPIYLIFANGLFVLYLHIRRKQIGLI